MTGLIEELSTQASDPTSSVTSLLQRMRVAAVRLQLGEPEEWVKHELEGYRDDDDLPSYRFIPGIPQSCHARWGWRTMRMSDDPTDNLAYGHIQFRAGVAALEGLASQGDILRLNFPEILEQIALRFLPQGVVTIGLFVSRSTIQTSLAAIRNKVLDWSLEMERAGVTGDGMSFSSEEKKVAQTVTYNFDMRGDNNRANFHSTDNSTNTVVHGQLFGELRAAVENGIDDPEDKAAIQDALANMEQEKTKSGFAAAYGRFMQSAANHMQVVQPFLGRLGEFLQGLPDL